jgi:hypothetical protein
VSVPVEWLVWIDRVECKGNGVRTQEGWFEVLRTWDDKLLESLKKRSIRIRSDLVKLWVDIHSQKTTWRDLEINRDLDKISHVMTEHWRHINFLDTFF